MAGNILKKGFTREEKGDLERATGFKGSLQEARNK